MSGTLDDAASSASNSPASSFDSSQAALNDSQQTVLTEPDHTGSPLGSFATSTYAAARSSPLSKEEAREVFILALHPESF